MPVDSKRICISTLGCKVNQYDTETMLGALRAAGFSVVDWDEPADVAIVNTCTVTAVADKKARALIRQAARRGIPVCVCGCFAERCPDKLRSMDGVAAVVTMKQRPMIVSIVGKLLGEDRSADVSTELCYDGPYTRTRGFLKIQDGCDGCCTYCIIPSVRGRSYSRTQEQVLADARRMLAAGVHELVLSGVDITSYGMDCGASLTALLESLAEMSGVYRLRLGSLSPEFLLARNIERLARIPKLCPHFHVSLQSGCSRTLHAMHRRYTAEQYARGIALLRQAFDDPAITTDIMTGFPGETDDDYQESFDFVRSMAFSRLHVFPFSERPGTPAAVMSDAVPMEVRRERAADMGALGNSLQKAYMDRFLHTPQQVLFDQACEDGASGYTDRYIRVDVRGAQAGTLADVLLMEQHGMQYRGELRQAE